jgi:hypothetical protein
MSENSRRSVLLCSLPALILSAACLLPYLNKAFVIDDPVFLLQAQQIRKAPLHPMALDICWMEDTVCGPVAQYMPGNVLMSKGTRRGGGAGCGVQFGSLKSY